jgi:soluble lytic murein transglycosylase-like protein
MAIRAGFLLFTGCFSVLLASGGLVPAAAEPHPHSPPLAGEWVALDPAGAAVDEGQELPPAVPDVIVELHLDPSPAVGLDVRNVGVEASPESAAPAPWIPASADPWAEAIGDAVRHGLRDSWAEALGEAARHASRDPWAEAVAESARVAARAVDPWAEAFAESLRIPALPERLRYVVVVNEQVQAFIERFTGSRRDVVGRWLERSRLYLVMIREVLREQGLPEELAFVPMIESGFNPVAVSRAGAKGMWQFMAGTARRYGLRVDDWVDERLDPEKSTAAAAAYLRDLYRLFGSWALAKAAYNAGEMRIVQAIRGVGTDDFWALARSRFLVQETKEFVPAIHAATVIGRDPTRFGFDPLDPLSLDVEMVAIPPGTSLARLARAAKVPLETLQTLNPMLIRGTTPPGAPFDLRIPPGSREAVLAAARLSATGRRSSGGGGSARAAAGIHVVKARETVTSIARQHGVSVREVLRWNGMISTDVIRPGDRLRVSEPRLAEAPRSRGK